MLTFHIGPPNKVVTQSDIHSVLSEAQQASVENQRIMEQLHKTTIIAEAIWELLKTKLGATDDELRKKIAEVEFEKAKSLTIPGECRKCARPLSVKSKKCVFCGEKVEETSLFSA